MKKTAEVFLALLFSFLLVETFNVRGAAAEPLTEGWAKTYGGTGDDFGWSVIQTVDGGYAIVGYAGSYGAGNYDAYLVKTDANGNMLWNKTYGGAADDRTYSVIQTSDGGYALAGYTGSYGAGGYDVWLIKTDANGNAQWNRTYGGKDYDYAWSMIQTSDGSYAIAGYTGSGVSSYDVYFVKTDANGNMQWNKTYGGMSYDWAYCVIETNDGGYAIAGYTSSFTVSPSTEVYLVKTDPSGSMQWSKAYGVPASFAESVVQTVDGGYAIAGDTYFLGAGSNDAYLIRTDNTGSMQWSKTFGGTGRDQGWSVIQTVDGGYAIAGITDSFGAGNWDAYLVKTDASGNMLWNKTYGGTGDDRTYSVIQTSDGGYALAGYTGPYGAGGLDVWLVKVPPEVVIPEFPLNMFPMTLMTGVTLTLVLVKKKCRVSLTKI
jgi:hypothetical protein